MQSEWPPAQQLELQITSTFVFGDSVLTVRLRNFWVSKPVLSSIGGFFSTQTGFVWALGIFSTATVIFQHSKRSCFAVPKQCFSGAPKKAMFFVHRNVFPHYNRVFEEGLDTKEQKHTHSFLSSQSSGTMVWDRTPGKQGSAIKINVGGTPNNKEVWIFKIYKLITTFSLLKCTFNVQKRTLKIQKVRVQSTKLYFQFTKSYFQSTIAYVQSTKVYGQNTKGYFQSILSTYKSALLYYKKTLSMYKNILFLSTKWSKEM